MGSFAGDQTMWNHFGYRTPIEGLYMAGSPTHPGGAISGGGGYIALASSPRPRHPAVVGAGRCAREPAEAGRK